MDAVMSTLTRDLILRAVDIRTERVDVPEWAGSVIVRGMTALERDTMLNAVDPKKDAISDSQLKAFLCAHCIVDEHGNSLFSDDDIARLQTKNPAVLDRIANRVLGLSGVGPGTVEAIEKN
jgi:hypothetical protein